MLTFAIAAFFALAFSGALLTIAAMFYTYQNKIKSVIIRGFAESNTSAPIISQRNYSYPHKAQRIKPRYPSSRRPVPLSAAA